MPSYCRKLLLFFTLVFAAGLSNAEPIKIGWIGPLSGPAAALGVDSVPAIKIVFDEINSKGGIQGRQLELVAEDDQYQTAKTVTAFKRLSHEEKIDVIFMITYGGLFAVAKDAQRNGVVLIDPLDCDDSIANLPENVFCVAKKSEDLGITNADGALANGFLPAAFIYYDGDPFMGTVAKSSINRIKEKGGQVAYEDGYKEGTVDFKSQLLRIKSSSAKSIFFYGYDEMGIAMKQARDLGIKTQFFAMNTISSPGFKDSAGSSAEGSYVGSWLAPRNSSLDKFLTEFQKIVGRKPYLEISTIPSFDVAKLIISALESADLKQKISSTVQSSLYKVKDYQGLSGKITIDEDGIVRSLKNYLFVFKNGQLELLPSAGASAGSTQQ